jgi:hypothetical protein
MIRQWFNTAPVVKSDKVRGGLIQELLQAVECERKGLPQTGRIKVKRVNT